MTMPQTQSLKWTIRMHKRDSAFVYTVFEAQGWVASYTTLPHQAADLHRDLLLHVSPDFEDDGRRILKSLEGLVHVIKDHARRTEETESRE